jgi:ADP-ribosyl-[dinitrogen reductase] hydrolase
MSLNNHILGCLLGGAIGDMLGGPYEQSSGASTSSTQFVHRGISDDTQLTLATCEAIVETQLISPAHIAKKFVSYFQRGQLTGLGASTLKALRDLSAGAHWALAGNRGERAAGNGAAMRIAPLAFCLDSERPDSRTRIRDVCRITHHHEEAYVGALAVVVAIRLAILLPQFPGRSLLTLTAASLPETAIKERVLVLAALDADTPIAEVAQRFGTSGYVVESVPLALYAAQQTKQHGLVSILEQIIAAGGDTDTNAAISGQIAGAWLGLDAVPQTLIQQLPDREAILATSRTFADWVSGRTG